MTDSGIHHPPCPPFLPAQLGPGGAQGSNPRSLGAGRRRDPRGERHNGEATARGGRGEPWCALPQPIVLCVNGERAPISGRFAPRGPAPPAYFLGTLTSQELFLRPLLGLL